MKTLEEKKFLARMSRNMGSPDLELEESIRLEEELNSRLFAKPKPATPAISILKEEIPVETPKPAETNIVPKEQDLIKQTVAAISSPAISKPVLPDFQQAEIAGLRKQIAEIVQKLGTLSWGSGGTGVVRFINLDDHQHPQDIRILSFNTDGSGVVQDPPEGSLVWNKTERCLDIHQDTMTLQVGQEQLMRVRNHIGATANIGTLVSFAGVNGNNVPTITPLVANTTFDPLYAIGVVSETIANGNIGFVTTFGKVDRINTTGSVVGETWNVGDLLWANPDPAKAGTLTKDKPTAPNVAISIAAVTKVDSANGQILVRPTLFPRLYYGNFSDLATQNCAASNTATAMLFNKTEFASGFKVVTYGGKANSAIQADNHGLYNFQFSSQFTSTSAARARIWIWGRLNGQDIPDSATVVAIESNGGVTAPAWNFIVSMQPTDKFQLMWATDAYDKITMLYQANTAFCPAIPSVLLSVSQINQ